MRTVLSRRACLGMSVAAVLVVAGCGSDEPDESEPSDNGSNENEPDENDNGD